VTATSLGQDIAILVGTFQARLDDVKRHYIGRDDVVDLLGLAALCREHMLLVGPPGTAKSSLLDRFSRMLGTSCFTYLLTRFTEPAELFGPLNVQVFQQESRYEVNTTGMLPEARIALLDEIFQGSSAILNTLLTLVNERKFHNGSRPVDTPLLSMLGSANEIPDDPVLAAFSDRFLLRRHLHYLPDDDLEDLMREGWGLERDRIRHDAGRREAGRGPDPNREQACFGLGNLERLYQELPDIDLAPVRQPFGDIVRAFRAEGVVFSDRRVVKAQKLIAASALLAGRARAEESDLAVLCSLWTDPKDEPSIQRIVADHGVPVHAGGGVRVPAEIQLDLQEIGIDVGRATSAGELQEMLRRLNRLVLELRRDHPSEVELAGQVTKQLRDAVREFRERFGQERLENV
jgi:MoxR-like ATPase